MEGKRTTSAIAAGVAMPMVAVISILVVAGAAPALSESAPARAPEVVTRPQTSCSSLAEAMLDDVKIHSAQVQPAEQTVPGSRLPAFAPGTPPPPDISGLPEFCRVVGSIHPEVGSDIRFEAWMPTKGWDGRLNGGNSGGFAGYINYTDLAAAVSAGQAGVATDTGHEAHATSGDWARGRAERIRDYGWRGVHLATVAAKQLVAQYYGRPPHKSYFIGCSNGGRQGLIEASRFPEDYDGIVAGAPASIWTNVAMSMISTVQAQKPKGARLRAGQIKFLQAETLQQCDLTDGLEDGLIADPRECKLDLGKLACGTSKSPQCFSPGQISALRRIYEGPRDSGGNQVAYGFVPSGAEVGNPVAFFGWEGWIAGTGDAPPFHEDYPREILENFVIHPFATVDDFDFSRHPDQLRNSLSAELDASPDLTRFFERGGKLIVWHGWADVAISPYLTLDFFDDLMRRSGPAAREGARLFMIPGLQHCAGGTGPGAFGQMSAPQPGDRPDRSIAAAIQAWVETGRVPNQIIGVEATPMSLGGGSKPGAREHLLCAYPARARLRAGADPASAASYTCE